MTSTIVPAIISSSSFWVFESFHQEQEKRKLITLDVDVSKENEEEKNKKKRSRRNTSCKQPDDVHLQENADIECPGNVNSNEGNTDVNAGIRESEGNTDVNQDVNHTEEIAEAYNRKSKLYTITPDLAPEIVIETYSNNEKKVVSGAKPGPNKHLPSVLISATSSSYFYSFRLANLKPHFVVPSASEYIKDIAGKLNQCLFQSILAIE